MGVAVSSNVIVKLFCSSHLQFYQNFITMSHPSNKDIISNALFNLKGRVALVTGGGSGIGLMITQALAVNGAKVYIVGRTGEKLDTVAKEYNGDDIDGEIIPLQGDVSKKEDIARLYNEISTREKCLCILVNNAGVSGSTFQQEDIARAVIHLVVNQYINGHNEPVDGGYSLIEGY